MISGLLINDSFKQDTGEVSFAGIGEDDDDEFAFVFGEHGHADGADGGGAAGDAAEDAFFAGEAAGHVDGFVIGDLFDVVDDGEVEGAGDEAGADTLDLMGAGLGGFAEAGLGDDGAVGGFNGDAADGFVFLVLDVAADAGDGAAGADAGDEDVDFAIGVFPDLGAGGFHVDSGVGGILELLQEHEFAGVRGADALGLLDGAAHAGGAGSENEIGAEGLEDLAAFDGHGLGHGEGDGDAAGGGNEGESDAGVAGGGFDDFLAGAEEAFLFGVPDHGGADAAFNAVGGVAALDFGEDGGFGPSGDAIEADEGGASDGEGIVFEEVHGLNLPVGDVLGLLCFPVVGELFKGGVAEDGVDGFVDILPHVLEAGGGGAAFAGAVEVADDVGDDELGGGFGEHVAAVGATAGFDEAALFEIGEDEFEEFLRYALAAGDVSDADGGAAGLSGEIENGL